MHYVARGCIVFKLHIFVSRTISNLGLIKMLYTNTNYYIKNKAITLTKSCKSLNLNTYFCLSTFKIDNTFIISIKSEIVS